MKKFVIPFIFATALLTAEGATKNALTLVGTIDLPDISGDVDHLAIDTEGQRLFLAAEDNGTLRVLDLKTCKLERTVRGFHTPHSILYLPAAQELYITDGSNAVHVLDSNTFAFKRAIPTMPGADSIAFDSQKQLLYAVTGGKDVPMTRSAISVIDTKAGKLKTEIPIDAVHVEAMALEESGSKLFVNVTDKNYLAVIDRRENRIIAKWPIIEAQQNAPLAFDEAHRRLFVVCRAPGKLVILDSANGRTIATFPTGARADGVIFDQVHQRVYVPAGEGKLYSYAQSGADYYTPLPPVTSAPGGKTALLSPDARHLYVAVSPGEGKTGSKVLIYAVE